MLTDCFFIIEYKLVGPHSQMPPPNLPTLGTKIKCVIAWWTTLLIMEDSGCSLTFVKVTNPNIQQLHQQLRLYQQLGAKIRYMIKEANRISLIYLMRTTSYME